MSLRPYQETHVNILLDVLKKHNIVCDLSNTGTGKTWTSLYICKKLKLKPLIICPKSVIPNWKNTTKLLGIKTIDIVNYDILKKAKQSYISLLKDKETYVWNLPQNSIIIFDEVHRCCSLDTQNNKLLLSIKEINVKALLLSATLISSEENVGTVYGILGIINHPKAYPNYIRYLKKQHEGRTVNDIHNSVLFPEYGHAMLISELGDEFPMQNIILRTYDLPTDITVFKDDDELIDAYNNINESKEIMKCLKSSWYKLYKKINSYIEKINEDFDDDKYKKKVVKIINLEEEIENEELTNKLLKSLYKKKKWKKFLVVWKENKPQYLDYDQQQVIVRMTYARIRVEQLRIPYMIEKCNDLLIEGCSVVIFLNFIESMNKMEAILGKNNLVSIYGDLTEDERGKNIDLFQSDKKRIILCQNGCASEGISLHDTHGNHPRVSLISPTYNTKQLVQILGRIYRIGTKTPVRQEIIYLNNTIEENLCFHIERKLKIMKEVMKNLDHFHIEGMDKFKNKPELILDE